MGLSGRWDTFCLYHSTRHPSRPDYRLSAHCKLIRDSRAAILQHLQDTETYVWRASFVDFCRHCGEHDTAHVNGRCVTAASQFMAYE